ncbi:ABC transporter permease [Marispirochaeta sp.]|jgi:ribose transport system permease protein|uniref:ABC transporter permease subunit n=1 Tax=Marispirochaeta sp. TaxID=2038653 RepID=UPI0029C7F8FE|nr:ABC transporter permease [Marispirochaeta sp.]
MKNLFSEKSLQKLMAPAALVILYLFFGFFGRNFFSYATLVNIFDASYYIGFIAIGVTFVIITGGIDLSVGTVMMCASIIGGTAYRTWGWPMEASLLLILLVGTLFGFFNGLMVSRLKLPPFIATLGTMMISMGVGSIVSNVRSATFPTRAGEDGWFKNIFKIITEDYNSIPTGAVVLLIVALIAYIILTKTRMGRYIFAIGSNKEAARLSGINVKKWEMMAYVTSGVCAGIGGIAFPAVYTTVMPAQGQGFELYAIAAAVIGGTSLSGGIGSVFGTLIGVYIISVLRSGLPAMDLQAHYQTFFTGVVVIGAVLLDIYRNKKASEVRVLSAADVYREDVNEKIRDLKQRLSSAGDEEIKEIKNEIAELKQERNREFRKMKSEQKHTQAQVKREERQADEELKRQLKDESEE